MTPCVSVVVPTFRRPQLLARCLNALCAQRGLGGAFEVIVVDDGRDDETCAVTELAAARHPYGPRIRYVRPSAGRGPAVARNAGWRRAASEVVAFTDDDTIPQADWLVRGLAALTDELAAVAGRVRVPRLRLARRGDDALPTDHELMTRGLETAEFVTANAFVWWSALEAVGGFDERFTRPWREDSDLQFRLQAVVGEIGRADDAVVVHPVRRERWGVSLRQQRNAFFDALLYKKHPRLYRERILAAPPWRYYAIVALALASAVFFGLDWRPLATLCGGGALVLIAMLADRRLLTTSRCPAHVVEMAATSAAIPFLSVYWRLRGAWHFRVLYL